jgi:AcrR family transcriptional regulator
MNDTGTPAGKVRERFDPGHRPQQDRSRVRFLALLDAAEEMIVESGLQGLAMRELARRANLPHSSVYHYFPSTTALIRALVERQFDKLSGTLETALRARFSTDDAGFSVEKIQSLVEDIAAFFFNTPSAPEIWAGLHAYPALRALNLEDTKKNAALLQPYLAKIFPFLEPNQAFMHAIVLVEWVSATLRFATASPPDVRAGIVEALKTLVAQSLTGISQTAVGVNAGQSNPSPDGANPLLAVPDAGQSENSPKRPRKRRACFHRHRDAALADAEIQELAQRLLVLVGAPKSAGSRPRYTPRVRRVPRG